MSDWIISGCCDGCGEWVRISEVATDEDADTDTCPRCGGAFYPVPDNLVAKPCEDCGRAVQWPADDDFGVICRPCIRALIGAA